MEITKCKIKGCSNKIHCKEVCSAHYSRMHRYGRWERHTNITGIGTSYSKEYARKYRLLKGIKSIEPMHKLRFGGLRYKVLKRDKYKCQVCGMNDKEHLEKFKVHITIDHIDGIGRYADKPHNSLDNLWTLCLGCHGKKDSLRHWIRVGKQVPFETRQLLRLE